MNRSRASALLTALTIVLSAMVGVTLAPAAASATPGGRHYPPPPPSLVVNHGVVNRGDTVVATGRKFRARERVGIVVRFKPQGSHRYRVIRTTTVYADRDGRFTFRLRATAAGYLMITATGRTSRQSASAYVLVIEKHRWGHGIRMRPAAFTGSAVSTAAAAPAAPAGNDNALAIAGLAVLAMAGGALVTRRTIRRRRGAADPVA